LTCNLTELQWLVVSDVQIPLHSFMIAHQGLLEGKSLCHNKLDTLDDIK